MVFKKEFKDLAPSFLIWTLATLGFHFLFLALMPSFLSQTELFREMMKSMPPELMKSFGLSGTSLFEPSGFIAYTYSYIQLILAIMALVFGLKLTGKERLSKSSEFLLTKPLSKKNIYLQKSFVGFVNILILNLLLFGLTKALSASWTISDGNRNSMVFMIFAGFLLTLFFFALANFLAVVLKKLRNPNALAVSIALGAYLLLLLARLLDKEWLTYLSPFGLAAPTLALKDPIPLWPLLVLIPITLLLFALGLHFYDRKDVKL